MKVVGKFLAKWKPHKTIQIGDEIDLPQLGGFNAGTIDERSLRLEQRVDDLFILISKS